MMLRKQRPHAECFLRNCSWRYSLFLAGDAAAAHYPSSAKIITSWQEEQRLLDGCVTVTKTSRPVSSCSGLSTIWIIMMPSKWLWRQCGVPLNYVWRSNKNSVSCAGTFPWRVRCKGWHTWLDSLWCLWQEMAVLTSATACAPITSHTQSKPAKPVQPGSVPNINALSLADRFHALGDRISAAALGHRDSDLGARTRTGKSKNPVAGKRFSITWAAKWRPSWIMASPQAALMITWYFWI